MFRIVAVLPLVMLAACPPERAPPRPACSEPMFGTPIPQTGLDDAQCRPLCTFCGDAGYADPLFDDARVAALRAWTDTRPSEALSGDPFKAPPPPENEGEMCGVVIEDANAKTYHAQTFESLDALEAAGAKLTHTGACGVCSTLSDLAVYALEKDIGRPVQKCSVDTFGRPVADLTACIVDRLGMTKPCAEIWAYNSRNTQQKCLDVCFTQLDAPYHQRNGALNTCIACEQRLSGPTMKAVAGRTRRNTGIASTVCVPCGEVTAIAHDY